MYTRRHAEYSYNRFDYNANIYTSPIRQQAGTRFVCESRGSDSDTGEHVRDQYANVATDDRRARYRTISGSR